MLVTPCPYLCSEIVDYYQKNYSIMEILLIIFILYTLFGGKKEEKKKAKKKKGFFGTILEADAKYWDEKSKRDKKYWEDVSRWNDGH